MINEIEETVILEERRTKQMFGKPFLSWYYEDLNNGKDKLEAYVKKVYERV